MRDRAVVLTGASRELVERYRGWLVAERGLASATIKYYVWAARLFLSERGGRDLKSLTLAEVTGFVVGQCPRFSVGHAKNLVAGLRSFLGYLFVEGVTDHQLAPGVPTPAGWHGSNLPRGVGAGVLAALLAGGDHATGVGRRDHAIVVLLTRLGCGPERSRRSLSTTSMGHGVRSLFGARATGRRRCPCRSTWDKRWWATCTRGGLRQRVVRCFCGARRRWWGCRRRVWVVSCDARVSERGCRRLVLIGYVTAQRPRCCAPGRRWRRLARCCVNAAPGHRSVRQGRFHGARGVGVAVAGWCGMSALGQAVDDYISVRRALGYKLAENARLLPDFVAYLEAAGASTVTSELAVGWATKPTGSTPVWWARRLAMVRGFARHQERPRRLWVQTSHGAKAPSMSAAST